MFLIGSHISSSGGFVTMAQTAHSLGANVYQFFTRNPRGGAARAWPEDDIAAYVELAPQLGITAPLAHAPYTLNAAAEKERTLTFAREIMTEDLQKLEKIPAVMYNFHPGSHVGQGVERGIELIIECLNACVTPDGIVPVLLETMSAKGTEVGGKFEELRAIIDGVDDAIRHRIGVTLDTCHIHDAGYDVTNNLDGVMAEFDRIVGLERLRAIHLNDTKNPLGARHDRHEIIGGGHIGMDATIRIINHEALRNLPFYLETPNDNEGYAREISLLKAARL